MTRPTTLDLILDANAQVTAFSQHLEDIENQLRKRSGLRERAGRQPRKREVLTDPGKRMRKLAIETGYDVRYEQFLGAPLEPWTGPRGSMQRYGELMRGEAPVMLRDWQGPGLDFLAWARDEELIAISGDGEVQALSDAKGRDQRKYPGAAVPDQAAGVGRRLGDKAVELMRLAWLNISRGRLTGRRSRSRRSAAALSSELQVPVSQVVAEANAIKARRRDLDEYRFLSLSRGYEVNRLLLDLHVIEEVLPPRHVRRERSWRTLPRVIRRLGIAGQSLSAESPP